MESGRSDLKRVPSPDLEVPCMLLLSLWNCAKLPYEQTQFSLKDDMRHMVQSLSITQVRPQGQSHLLPCKD